MDLQSIRLKKDQVLVLVLKDFKLKYNSTALGFVWSLVMPLLSSLIYYFVFGIMMRFNKDHYLLYLLTGTFLWQFFSNVVMMNGSVLLGNASLLKKTSFDHNLLIWGTFFTESIHFFLTIPILVGLLFFEGITPNIVTIIPNILLAFVLLAFLASGVSYAYSAINLYFRDLERMMQLFMQLWMFMTPIFIPEDAIPSKYSWIYVVNPMAGIVRLWRDAFYHPVASVNFSFALAIVCIVVFLTGRMLFNKFESKFAEMM